MVTYETNKLVNRLLMNLNKLKSSEGEIKNTINEYFENTDFFINILDDCFGLISQSIQAIRTLQYENINLKEQIKEINLPLKNEINNNDLTISQLDNHNENEIISQSFNSRISLRQKLKTQVKENTFSTSFENLESVKITNFVIKSTNITERYNIYFGEKYGNGSYKTFLENIVKMKYSFDVLKEIEKDIERLQSRKNNEVLKYKTFVEKVNNTLTQNKLNKSVKK
jgi:hypothetical protein